jgi:hypothetical protein
MIRIPIDISIDRISAVAAPQLEKNDDPGQHQPIAFLTSLNSQHTSLC